MKPNDILTLDIQSIGDDGDGIATLGRRTVYVSNSLPGERVCAIVADVAKTYAHATPCRIVRRSPHRVQPKCQHIAECGGCQVQELDYDAQLLLKRQKVVDNLQSAGVELGDDIPDTIGSRHIFNFRNKAIYPVARNSDGEIVAGFYARRSHLIVPSAVCPVGPYENAQIVGIVIRHLIRYDIEPYNEATHTGTVRYIMIRKAFATDSVMVSIVINGQSLPYHRQLVDSLLQSVNTIKDISLTINCHHTNRIRGNEVVSLYGDGYITNMIDGIKFRISPLSFYQVNASQTQVLYDKVLELANLNGDEIVWDLYCGVGTISLYLARHCRKVFGVEIIPQAVANARQNAAINMIRNVDFMEGKAEEIVSSLASKLGTKCDVVIVDPPRKGCEKTLLDTIIYMRPSRIVYVSCDSQSLARDLRYLQDNGFKTKHVQPVDMFPHTVHVESVALVMPQL